MQIGKISNEEMNMHFNKDILKLPRFDTRPRNRATLRLHDIQSIIMEYIVHFFTLEPVGMWLSLAVFHISTNFETKLFLICS